MFENNEKENVLEKYGRDITKNARDNKIDPVIGRDEEIRSITRILSRKTKNNPVLIGEPGVGKTAIVEGLASRIISGDVPLSLQNKKIWELDFASVVAGAKYRGEFEERLKKILKEIKDSNGEIIMFIDEIHMIVGNSTDGAMDAGNMLKPMLARGEIKCIGATTLNEYRKYIEKDGALERRFQKIIVNAPNKMETITIIRGLKERFEAHHGVVIKDNAIIAATNLSDRYITDRYLPDKAIDLIDEACANIKVQMESVPSSLDNLRRDIMILEIERQALKKEKDDSSKIRVDELNDKISKLKVKEQSMTSQFNKEKEASKNIKELKAQLENLKNELKIAENNYDLEKAAILRHGKIPELEKNIENLKNTNEASMISDVVDENSIADIISKWTNIPVTKLVEGEKEKLLSLYTNMKKRVKGQDVALQKVTNCILRARSGIKDPNKPIGSFIFLGPTGVGKTEVAKTLASELFDDEKHMIRFDMSEYMEAHSVSRLVGAPPGYIGYEEGGQLTEAVRRNPYSIILFDEIEKAHKDVFNILLQILDDGRITDSQGRTVDFKNTIIIMTSNIGSEYILGKQELKEEIIMKDLGKFFKPEFLNRIDEIITFNTLNKEVIVSIIDNIIESIQKLLDNKKIKISLTNKAKEFIINASYNEDFGARPIKRYITNYLETNLAEEMIKEEITNNSSILVDVKDNELFF